MLPAQLRGTAGEIVIPDEVQEGDYDLICIGSPTWFFKPSGPERETVPEQLVVSTAQAVVAVLFGLALMLAGYYGPAVAYRLFGARAEPLLGAMSEWITGHARPLEIVTGGVLGPVFLGKGLAVLI
jgi:hypothetical protein